MDWFSDNGMLLGLAMLDGLSYASVFMVAVGLNLVFGVMRVLNVAHGSLYAIGGYAAASLSLFLMARGMPQGASLPVLVVSSAIVGVILGPPIERLLRRMQGQEEVLQLLVTFALFMILEDLQKLVWGVQPVVSDAPVKVPGTVDVTFGADVIPFTAYQLYFPRRGTGDAHRTRLVSASHARGPDDRRRDGQPRSRAGDGHQCRQGHAADLHGGRGARRLGRRARIADDLAGAGPRRLDHRAVFRGGRDRGSWTDRRRGVDRAHDRPRRSLAVYFASEFEVVVPYVIMVSVLLVRPQGLFAVPETRRI